MKQPKDMRILLVEDNPDDIELTLRVFRKYHIINQIIVARDGEEALEHLFNSRKGIPEEERPDLILLDLKLPKVDGLEVLRQIKSHPRTQPIPVVILTSSKEEDDLIKSYQLGVNSYIRKPVNFDNFIEVIRQLGLYWLLLNEPPPPPPEK
ncbi:MAG: response regulator [Candidatus Omnitrophica bacterium]|nr:response regulator [Candidatus Omnitrophota bacterium]